MIEYYKKPKKSKKWILIIIFIVIMSAIGALGYTWLPVISTSDKVIIKTITQSNSPKVYNQSVTKDIAVEETEISNDSDNNITTNTPYINSTAPLDEIMHNN